MLASLMVLQTELPPLEFDILRGKKKQEYFFIFFLEGVWGSSFTTCEKEGQLALFLLTFFHIYEKKS